MIQCCSAAFDGKLSDAVKSSGCSAISIPEDDYFYGPKKIRFMNYIKMERALPNDCVFKPLLPVSSL